MSNDRLSPREHAEMRDIVLAGTQRIKPAGAHRMQIIAASVALVLVAGVTGGAIATAAIFGSEAIAPAVTPTPIETAPTPTPSATPTPERIVAETTPRLPFDCADVASDVAPFFEGTSPPVAGTTPRLDGNASWLPGPAEYAFAQAGALLCEYGSHDGAWATVIIVPDAEGAIEDRDATVGPISDCDGHWPCELINGAYVEVIGQPENQADEDLRRDATSMSSASVRERVAAASIAAPQWEPPTASSPIAGGCDVMLTADEVNAIFGVTDVQVHHPEGGWGIHHWMIASGWGARPCYFTVGDSMSGQQYGVLTWLPGGEWAYVRSVAGDVLSVPGLTDEEEARVTCDTVPYYSCVLDLLVDGNWVRYSLPIELTADERSRVLTDIATTIASSLHSRR